jgi:hypothetical protein
MTMLREGLLDGRAVALAGGVSPVLRGALAGLGARVEEIGLSVTEQAAQEWAGAVAPV